MSEGSETTRRGRDELLTGREGWWFWDPIHWIFLGNTFVPVQHERPHPEAWMRTNKASTSVAIGTDIQDKVHRHCLTQQEAMYWLSKAKP